jgi:nucleoid-associated protein YgaU
LKKQTSLKIIFFSLILSSCGLIGNSKSPENPTDSSNEATASKDSTDDLFKEAMTETSSTESTATDAPNNVEVAADEDLKSLEDEFSSTAPRESVITETSVAEQPKIQEEAPVIVEESIPEIKNEAVMTPGLTSEVKTYRVQKGETLMQIAFKLYGDISKWKELKNMNSGKLASNSTLRANSELKYHAPEAPFVWNPTGTPYLIKTGETLGTISNTVYSTPKKWKTIWENNKPLIKNPNVIYAGFTLYYPGTSMANYVQPEEVQTPKKIVKQANLLPVAAAPEKMIEEIISEEEIKANKNAEREIAEADENDISTEVSDDNSLDSREEEIIAEKNTTKSEELEDEAVNSQAATNRNNSEIDLINNVSAPETTNASDTAEANTIPDIDEEVQVL